MTGTIGPSRLPPAPSTSWDQASSSCTGGPGPRGPAVTEVGDRVGGGPLGLQVGIRWFPELSHALPPPRSPARGRQRGGWGSVRVRWPSLALWPPPSPRQPPTGWRPVGSGAPGESFLEPAEQAGGRSPAAPSLPGLRPRPSSALKWDTSHRLRPRGWPSVLGAPVWLSPPSGLVCF